MAFNGVKMVRLHGQISPSGTNSYLEGVKIGPYFVANCKVNHSALSARSLKRHSFETSLHHEAKSSAIWDVHSYGASSQEGLP